MKKRSNFILAGLMVFVLAMTLAYPSWAEDLIQPGSTLESKMSELIDSQNKLTVALQKALEPNNQFKIPDSEPQQAGGDGTNTPPPQSCTQNYQEWPSSNIYKRSDWDPYEMMFAGNNAGAHYYDINGDGLLDYFFLSYAGSQRQSCVHLNTGRGWDMVYGCYAYKNNLDPWIFYGDCAKQ